MAPAAPSRSKNLHPGDVIDGRYRILRKLADGGMGTVFLGEHLLIKRRLAIKLLHPELATDRGMVHRFLNEGSAAGTLGHPHIVESTDMGFTRDRVPYIVFEYLEGCLLTEEIWRLGRLPVARAVRIGRQIASALEAVHAAQIAHLDLKSDNVFLTHRGDALDHAKLLDFGISRFMAGDPGHETTQTGILVGTPEFMAPEQVTDPAAADCRADIYALGVLLYEMLTGRCPFVADDPRWVLHRIVHDTPPPLDREVPAALERLLFDGLLVKPRDRRLQTMGEITAILDALLVAMRSGIPDGLGAFTAPDAHDTIAQPMWIVESWFDDAREPIDPVASISDAVPYEIWP
ncbi:MAG TPA: serine/threonine-protein kinase [Kofleriaceae bacterium]|nr:serine/threonine-protein kinase [Kofleriaceae bacterium]